MVIWLIGLAGAGKTSVGKVLSERLRARGETVVFLDGDVFRRIMGDELGHGLADRERNGARMCRMCEFLEHQGVTVVCSILSMFPEQRAWNRRTYGQYFETYIDVPLDVLEARDQKGLYSGAREGRIKNVAGIDLEFVPPENPDYVFCNDRPLDDFDGAARDIIAAMDRKFAATPKAG